MTLINLTSRLPMEAINEGYDLLMRQTENADGRNYTTVWLRKNKEEIVRIYAHVPSIIEVKDDYLEHKAKQKGGVANV